MEKLQPCTNMDKTHQLLDKFTSGVEVLPCPIKDQHGRLRNLSVYLEQLRKKATWLTKRWAWKLCHLQ